jgi:hypothetical protein
MCDGKIKNYAIRDGCKFILFNFSHLVIPTIRILEVVRWSDDDTITHDSLRMRNINVTNVTNPTPS